ncbi:MAG: hypothetical protein LBC71_04980 [Oscillospiraceae bacterium]|jgi:hypothetical protein|nr:hypothetical protein [Oscillospiraceae bacterium]
MNSVVKKKKRTILSRVVGRIEFEKSVQNEKSTNVNVPINDCALSETDRNEIQNRRKKLMSEGNISSVISLQSE